MLLYRSHFELTLRSSSNEFNHFKEEIETVCGSNRYFRTNNPMEGRTMGRTNLSKNGFSEALSPGNFQSSGSILKNYTLVDRVHVFNLMGLHFDPMSVVSSIEGKQKGLLQQSDNNNCSICNFQ